jgi:hypothetical protein
MKQNFWKIFKSIQYNSSFRELIEKTLAKYPGSRFTLEQIRNSNFFKDQIGEEMTSEGFLDEIRLRFMKVEQERQNNLGQFNHENSLYYSEVEADDDFLIKDNEQFQEAREKYIQQVEDISKMLRHQRNMKKIKKECMKNMIAGPSLLEPHLKPSKHSSSFHHKDSHLSCQKSHKNSLVGPAYNSDTEDNKH